MNQIRNELVRLNLLTQEQVDEMNDDEVLDMFNETIAADRSSTTISCSDVARSSWVSCSDVIRSVAESLSSNRGPDLDQAQSELSELDKRILIWDEFLVMLTQSLIYNTLLTQQVPTTVHTIGH